MRSSTDDAATGCAVFIVTFVVLVALGTLWWGWLIMLGLGIVHGSIAAGCPHPGLAPCLAVGVIAYLLFGDSVELSKS
jgi:hypothetical protein